MNKFTANAVPSPALVPLVATKLHIPPVADNIVARQRLAERIEQALTGKLTYLSAPSGYGKSTLLAYWARRTETRPAWYSLEAADNDPARFWQYIIWTVDAVVPGFAERADAAAKLLWPAQYEAAITMLINELQLLESSLVVVLDDFHHLANADLISSFAYFIEYLPSSVHVIVASRTEPPFPTSRLMSRQWMTRLVTEDLRFTPQEGREFYASSMNLDLSEQETGEWVARTEGWITAMKLAALSLRDSPDAFGFPSGGLPDNANSLEQYLLEEVYLQQSEPVRRLLTDCSVLQRMNASLCRAVTGLERCQETLAYLSGNQLFTVPLDERRGWYRLHPLFADFLHGRLRREGAERIAGLLERAGEWCEKEGLQEEALEYYLTGEQYERGIALLEAMTARRLRVSPVWLGALLSRIPDRLLMRHPFLYFSCVHMFMVGTDYARAERMMQDAAAHYPENERTWTAEQRRDFWGSFYYLRMIHTSIVTGDPEETLRCIELSKRYSPEGTRLIFAQSGIAGLPSVVQKFIRSNKFVQRNVNLALLEHMSSTAGEAGSSMRTCLAEALYGYNMLDEARSTAEDALDTAMRFDPNVIPEILLAARLVLFRVHRAAGRRGEALDTMKTTRKDMLELGLLSSLVYCDAELALLALEEGDREPAAAWIERYRPDAGAEAIAERLLYAYPYAVRIHAGLGRVLEAERLAGRLVETARDADLLYIELELFVQRSLLLAQSGRTDEALALLRQALFRSEPREYARLFIDAGEPMAELLALAIRSWDRQQTAESPTLGYMRRLLTGFGRTAAADGSGPGPDLRLLLTAKEYAVLQRIARRRTNNEIAAELGIGYGTVRTHLHHIYGKLSISTREEAIRIGELLED